MTLHLGDAQSQCGTKMINRMTYVAMNVHVARTGPKSTRYNMNLGLYWPTPKNDRQDEQLAIWAGVGPCRSKHKQRVTCWSNYRYDGKLLHG